VFFLLYLTLAVACALLALRLVEQPARRAIRQRWGRPRSSPQNGDS
jgi:peptidoglycan/LPS O-acetylase OafA/YrhL